MQFVSFDSIAVVAAGLLGAKVYLSLARLRPPKPLDYTGYTIVFGSLAFALTDLCYQVVCSLFLCKWSPELLERVGNDTLDLYAGDYFATCLASLLLAGVGLWLRSVRVLHKIGESLGISSIRDTDSTFKRAIQAYGNQLVRFQKPGGGYIYEGVIENFYESDDEVELLLKYCELRHIDSETYVEKIDGVYLSLPKSIVHLLEFHNRKSSTTDE